MRIHRLEVTAFGPFAEHQVVDFDRLTEAGLFLLHGPTGAGKTSVLDAVCFALYGRVPGARGAGHGGRLRSDHAGPAATPLVACEFTVSGRRFEVIRSPEWQRPKKRGTGTVREQARVVLRERVGDGWNPLTSRIDEAGDLLGRVLGLGVDQFTKLVLLPQGDFAAFLRASAEERRPLLQKLFGTERFDGVERWGAERRRAAEHQVQAARAVTARLLARAEQARLDPDDPEPAAADPELAARLATGWAQAAGAQVSAAHAALVAADRAHELARRDHDEALAERRREDRRAELTAELAGLRAAAADHASARARLAAAAHTAVLAPVLADLSDAEGALATAGRRREQAAAAARATELAALLAESAAGHEVAADAAEPDQPPADLAERAGELHEELGRLAELLAARSDLAELDRLHGAGARRIEAAELQLAEVEVRRAALTARAAELVEAGAGAALIAATGPDRSGDCARARAVAEAVVRQDRLAAEHAEAADALRVAIDAHQAAVAASQHLRARRLDGMAAELATALADGAPCPVCGSCAHPRPAEATAPAVTGTAQQRAATAETEAAARRERIQGTVQALAEQLAAARALTGGADAERAARELTAAEAALAQAREAAGRVRELATAGEAVTAELARLAGLEGESRAAAVAEREALAEIAGRRGDLRDRLERGRGQSDDVAGRHRRVAEAIDALQRWLLAGRTFDEARARCERTRQAAQDAGRAAGFDDLQAAAAAVLPEPERSRLAVAVEQHEAGLARAEALLADLAPTGPDGQPVLDLELGLGPDLDDLAARQAAARGELEQAGQRHTLATRALHALSDLAAELDRHATATGPLRRRHAVLDSVSRCTEGTGGDNALKMRLSSYVLAARLEQVAEAASVRLEAMSGGRYQLVHTDGPARGGARSGLGLAVVDGWTGVQRDPGTLSGGETFCTALALALGLADVVQAEAGGSAIETLLVDEGFGTLDEQTLDEVMDVLDGLRSAGRSVGLVSHVADLRHRIPAQLEVVKTRTGSRLIA